MQFTSYADILFSSLLSFSSLNVFIWAEGIHFEGKKSGPKRRAKRKMDSVERRDEVALEESNGDQRVAHKLHHFHHPTHI